MKKYVCMSERNGWGDGGGYWGNVREAYSVTMTT